MRETNFVLKPVSAVLLAACLAMVVPAHAGQSMEHAFSGDELMSRGAFAVVVVATIVSVDAARKHTNGDPPTLVIEIHEVLKGSARPGTLAAKWLPFPHDVDWVGKGSAEAYEAWAGRLNAPPELGSKWILSSWRDATAERLDVAPTARWPLTVEKRAWVVEQLNAASSKGAKTLGN